MQGQTQVLQIDPLRHGFAVPPLPKGRGFGKDGKFTDYRLTSSAVDRCGRDLPSLPRALPFGRAVERSETERVRSGSNPLRHGFAVPPLPKGRGFGKGEKFCAYKLASSSC